jgi:hypothetical protein
MKMIKATEKEISKTIDKAIKIVEEEKGELSYEEGVKDALTWVLGEADNPLDEE